MAAIRSIHIHQLLRLRDIRVDFAESGVTAIMGANGTGKTTLLQALACVYQKDRGIALAQDSYDQIMFFKDHDGNNWQDSRYDLQFYEGVDDTSYICDAGSWEPREQNKKHRYTKYVPIMDCVPDQEKESADIIENFTLDNFSNINERKKRTLISKVSGALNRQYVDTQIAVKEMGLEHFMYATVRDRSLGDISYPSHYMGAGEQKIIHIMKEVLSAPNYSFILIEELEISLHDSAIKSLITFLLEQAEQRNLQIIFTTHWLRIQEFEEDEKMNIASLYVNPATDVVTVRNGFDPQFIHNLNGDYEQRRQIRVWVEDGLAKKIVEHVAREIDVMQFLKVKIFGSIQNAYMIAGAVAVMGENTDRTLIVTDGDRFVSEEEKRRQIQNALDGNGAVAEEWREKALSLILGFDSPDQKQPEQVILDMCQILVDQDLVHNWVRNDLSWIDQQNPTLQGKNAMRALQQHKNISIDNLEAQFLEAVCDSTEWNEYTESLRARLREVVEILGIEIQDNEVAA